MTTTEEQASGPAPATTDGAPDHNRFPALDGLRAVAVGAVVLTHVAFATGRYSRGPGSSILAHLDVGVAIFFVISGFLLSREWFVAHVEGRQPVRLVAYLWRRALRILPLYWVTVTAALLLLRSNRNATSGDWLRHFALLQIYRPGWLRNGVTQTWSLCTEALFYLVLPAFAVLIVRLARGRLGLLWAATLVCAGLVVLGVVWTLYFWSSGAAWLATAQLWLPSTIGWFAAGMAMAGVHAHLTTVTPDEAPRLAWIRELGAHPGVCWSIAACAYLLVVTPLSGPLGLTFRTPEQGLVRSLLYLVVAAALVWPAVFGASPLVLAVLANRPMRYLGDVSYGVFLLHLLVLEGVQNLLDSPLGSGSVVTIYLLTLALTIPVAGLAFRWLERPAMSLRRLVPSRRRSAPTRPPDVATDA